MEIHILCRLVALLVVCGWVEALASAPAPLPSKDPKDVCARNPVGGRWLSYSPIYDYAPEELRFYKDGTYQSLDARSGDYKYTGTWSVETSETSYKLKLIYTEVDEDLTGGAFGVSTHTSRMDWCDLEKEYYVGKLWVMKRIIEKRR